MMMMRSPRRFVDGYCVVDPPVVVASPWLEF